MAEEQVQQTANSEVQVTAQTNDVQASAPQQTNVEAQKTAEPAKEAAGTIAGNTAQGTSQNVQQAPAEPIQYDLSKVKAPEGFEFNQAEQDKFVDIIRDMKLSNEDANKISQFGVDWANGIVDSIQKSIIAERTAWGEAATKELGADFDKTCGLVATAVEHFERDIPGLRNALNITGAGNRIEILQLLAAAGKMISSDPGMAAGAGAQASGSNAAGNSFKTLYPNTDFDKYRA